MASLILACIASCSDCVSKRGRQRRQGRKEYRENFENLKAENLRRESWRQSCYLAQAPGATIPAQAPPSYEDITARKSMEPRSGARLSLRPAMETVQERSGDVTPQERMERTDGRGQS
ncbi:hypothetical protein BLS_002469 [Venturia inaequalis]|uniref:Uncharacterized protein n=1 Tax=Venturia inaequalis TaxID=5025 RepID=A0A8H3U0I1_VENIN|nr:hypothetical protein EG328_010274 [Venturia inaequalis]KAE9975722.1 hypothetical protein BLS_002469 [Venturia inaequalis]KAE9984078.1 hypothetical protein EG327_005245 [Venturia inaequalis]RDI78774.1 hypothetical protein Vi05172_g11137 [Venturia inaequalis]